MAELLPRLYAAALALPELGPTTALEPPGISHEQWAAVASRLRDLLGEADLYAIALEPLDVDREQLSVVSLADDLTDIYRDLKKGLDSAEQLDPVDIVWGWRFSFWTHWGEHASRALAAVHLLLEHAGASAAYRPPTTGV